MEKNCCFPFCFIAMPLTNTYHPEIATKFSCCIVCSKSDKVDVLSLTISFIRVNGPTNCLTNFLQNITNSQSLASNLTVDSKSNLLDLFNFRKLKFAISNNFDHAQGRTQFIKIPSLPDGKRVTLFHHYLF